MKLYKHSLILIGLLLCSLLAGNVLFAQCSSWSAKATVTASSTCAANASFTVTLTGPDVSNLSNIQYGIPLGPDGFSVPLNNSATFNNIPSGIYQVAVVATCGGALVGKNTTIHVPGAYDFPSLIVNTNKNSLSCGAYGVIGVSVISGRAPFTINMTSSPASYSGPRTFTTSSSAYSVNNLPPGTYTFQAVDACGNGTPPASATVNGLATPSLYLTEPTAISCSTVSIGKPSIQTNIGGWMGYYNDGLFKATAQISGGVTAISIQEPMNNVPFSMSLASGKTIKDCYGQSVNYVITPPCGASFTASQVISYPQVVASTNQDCNVDFEAELGFTSLLCFPVTYSVRNTATGTSYGPYSTSNPSGLIPVRLPLGNYAISFTTGDGYTGSGTMSTAPIAGVPYRVSIMTGASGLHNYIEGFEFTTTAASSYRTIELFNGPAGYSYLGGWSGSNRYPVTNNQTPVLPNTLKFPAGNYVWKITDQCGTYYLPITVGPQHLYQYTVLPPTLTQTCSGLSVLPAGSATNNGNTVPIKYSVLKDGYPMYDFTGSWPQYPAGTPFTILGPGTYTIVPASTAPHTVYVPPYPNAYTQSYTFTHTLFPVMVDINQSQGYICAGGSSGQGQIFVTGKDGMPYRRSGLRYNYYLAAKGNGASGPYIASNSSGTFSGFGANANDEYDVKVEDSCGAFAVQRLQILDLAVTHLISASNYVACSSSTVQLSALFIPGATYSWTGPNSFSSTLREPVITSVSAANVGVYRLVITIPNCSQTMRDSTTIAMAPNPPKPLVDLICDSPATMTITNPSAPFKYEWELGIYNISLGYYYAIRRQSNFGYSKYVDRIGSYKAVAIDTTTGCYTYSDSLEFSTDPNEPIDVAIYSPHLKICSGDTTILVAPASGILPLDYQWFKDGVLLPADTSQILIVHAAGKYKVRVMADVCTVDTSDEVEVTIVPIPTASISISANNICLGETATLQTTTGTNYEYTWSMNGSTIPGANGALLVAHQTGSYNVTISNGGCVAVSPIAALTVHNPPVTNLQPGTDTVLCKNDVITLQTPTGSLYTYTWQKNGTTIPASNSNTYNTTDGGRYSVIVSHPYCNADTSQEIEVKILPSSVQLPPDTLICKGSFAVPMSVEPGFANIRWSTGESGMAIVATARGQYWVEAQNICGTFSDTMYVRTAADYKPELPNDTLICNEANSAGLSVPVLAQHILWSTGDTTANIAVSKPGKYWVQLQSPCDKYSDTVRVKFCEPKITSLQPYRDSVCEGDCVEFIATVANYPQQYEWSFDGGTPSKVTGPSAGIICYPAAGVYPVTLTATNAGGTTNYTSSVVVVPYPKVRFEDTAMTLSYKSEIVLPACADAMTTDWYRDGELVCSNCKNLTIEPKEYKSSYICVVKNLNCTDSCTYNMQVVDIPNDVWLPTGFSPNNDGRNDIFRVVTDNPNVRLIEFVVYNRWGEQVYHGNNIKNGWDGTYNGKLVDVGTYYWSLKYEVTGGQTGLFKKGDVLLIR